MFHSIERMSGSIPLQGLPTGVTTKHDYDRHEQYGGSDEEPEG